MFSVSTCSCQCLSFLISFHSQCLFVYFFFSITLFPICLLSFSTAFFAVSLLFFTSSFSFSKLFLFIIFFYYFLFGVSLFLFTIFLHYLLFWLFTVFLCYFLSVSLLFFTSSFSFSVCFCMSLPFLLAVPLFECFLESQSLLTPLCFIQFFFMFFCLSHLV